MDPSTCLTMPSELTASYGRPANRFRLLLCCLTVTTFGTACGAAPDGTAESMGSTAQSEVSLLRLAPASDSLEHTFEVIAGIRDLGDGRVLVSDERATQLLVVDFRSDSVGMLGGRGQGPGEYQQVARLWPTSGDTTLHKEPFAPRFLVLVGSEAVATLGPADSAIRYFTAPTPILGVDSSGNAIVAAPHRGSGGRVVLADSLHVVRIHWRTGTVDTIARVQSDEGWLVATGAGGTTAPAAAATASSGGAQGPGTFSVGIRAPDQIAVLPSGWIAIARAEPYRVDWCSPEGECTQGPVVQSESPVLTDEYKQVHLRRAALTFGWPPTENVDETSRWPRVLPPFMAPSSRTDASAMIAAPGDRVLVRRTADVASAMVTRYDIFDRVHGLAGWIELPLSDRVVGFGAEHIYVARTTEDGWQLLRRHPWEF